MTCHHHLVKTWSPNNSLFLKKDPKYLNALESALEPYKKAAAIFAKKENLTVQDKQQYKKAVGYLADIYSAKKLRAKDNATEQAKFAEEEKRWNDLYDTIK